MADEHKIVDTKALARNNQNFRNEMAPINFSIHVSTWTSSEDSSFPFTAEIAAGTVTANDLARVDFDKESIKAAVEAVIITGETAEGKICLLAEKMPTTTISGVYRIIKGEIE